MNNKPEEIFDWNGISIRQHDDVFKIGTDALLLGGWVPGVVEHAPKILDVGTGCGIIGLMMAYYFKASSVLGIDQDKSAVDIAVLNYKNSPCADRLDAREINILEYSFSVNEKFDLVVCNPPFFHRQIEAKTDVNMKAKHTRKSVEVWMKTLAASLKPNGHMCIIIPSDVAFNWIRMANEWGLYNHDRLEVFSFTTDDIPVRSLLHFHHVLKTPNISRLNIYGVDQRYTEAYLEITKIGHTHEWLKSPGQKL